jgi:hypothetical protein
MNSLTDYAKPAADYVAAGVGALGGVMFANKLNRIVGGVLEMEGPDEEVTQKVFEQLKLENGIHAHFVKSGPIPIDGKPGEYNFNEEHYYINRRIGVISERNANIIGGIAGAAIAYYLSSLK